MFWSATSLLHFPPGLHPFQTFFIPYSTTRRLTPLSAISICPPTEACQTKRWIYSSIPWMRSVHPIPIAAAYCCSPKPDGSIYTIPNMYPWYHWILCVPLSVLPLIGFRSSRIPRFPNWAAIWNFRLPMFTAWAAPCSVIKTIC